MDQFPADNFFESVDPFTGPTLIEDVIEQSAFTRAGDSGYTGQDAQGNLDIDMFEVVFVGVADLDELPRDSW